MITNISFENRKRKVFEIFEHLRYNYFCNDFQVIIALADKTRQHIPYRNSMMTSVLRDSLGGNCMTTMIATCAIDKRNLDVSIVAQN